MAYFFLRLLPPRPSFPVDMSEGEKKIMQNHLLYWKTYVDDGTMIAFGPVADSKGPWGLGLLSTDSEGKARALAEADPAMRANTGFSYELFPMPNLVYKTS